MDERELPSPASMQTGGARRGRIVALALMLALTGAAYALLFSVFDRQAPPVEKAFQEIAGDDRTPLNIYLEVLGVDPVREAIEFRLDFSTTTGPSGRHYPGASPIDLVVHVSDGADVQDIPLLAGQPTPSKTLQLDVTGDLHKYPLDQYTGNLRIGASEGRDALGGTPMPIRLTTWEDIAGWAVTISRGDLAPKETGLPLTVTARRPLAQIVFAFLLYAAMALIAGSALTLGGLTFVGMREIEATLIGAVAAMVFSVPALRSVLPGAPPLGVGADDLVFLWVQLAVILGLTLFVAAWALNGRGG